MSQPSFMQILLGLSYVNIGKCSPALLIVLTLSSILLLWRLWKFTIIPYLWPNEPKELPYWIPVLGHAYKFMNNTNEFLAHASKHFNHSGEPFAVTVAGRRIVIIADFQDVATVWKRTTVFDYGPFVKGILHTFGVPRNTVHRLFQDIQTFIQQGFKPSRLHTDNPQKKCLNDAQIEWFLQQVKPGKNLDALQATFTDCISKTLHFDAFSSDYLLAAASDTRTLSLYRWCGFVLVEAITKSLFSEVLFKIDPALHHHFFELDTSSWKILLKYPYILAKDMHRAKRALTKTFEVYFNLPSEQRSGSSGCFQTQDQEMRHLGFDVKDTASIAVLYYWVMNANSYKICFWILSHMLFDPCLLTTITEEIEPACHDEGDINMEYLLSSCPRLDALWNEILRLYNAVVLVRDVASATTLGGKNLHSGDIILSNFSLFHMDSNVFGEDVLQFRSDRFLKDKSLGRAKTWRPFGGGATYCPGRFLAKGEVYAFIALILHRFELRINLSAGQQAFPKPDLNKPNLGAMAPVSGQDVVVDITSKRHC